MWRRFVFVCVVLAGPSALAETRRVAIVVGQNNGGPGEVPLRFAEDDAGKVAEVLVQLGDVPPERLLLLRGRDRAAVKDAIDRAGRMIGELRGKPDDRAVLVFYYSGHADTQGLEIGAERLPYAELRAWLAATKADVRVEVLDSCKSGAARTKGGKPGPAFEIRLTDDLATSGEALLSSSAADEMALESQEIRGSFFTHHLVSGLRGAADASGDGRVTLSEAYQYAFDRTVSATARAGAPLQHPEYDYRLSGQGELVLTDVGRPAATLELPKGFDRAVVILVRRDQVVAELTSDGVTRLAVAPGEYAVRLWKGKESQAGRIAVQKGEARQVAWTDLSAGAPEPLAAKGGGPTAAERSYAEKELHVGPPELLTTGVASSSGQFSGVSVPVESYTVYEGRNRRQLEAEEFYRLVGRPDLAERYSDRVALRTGVQLGSVAVVLGGVALTAIAVSKGGDCTIDSCKGYIIGGSVLSLVGIVGLSFSPNPHPISTYDLRRLANEYNDKLRRDLGLDDPVPPAQTSIAPFWLPGGGGVALGGQF